MGTFIFINLSISESDCKNNIFFNIYLIWQIKFMVGASFLAFKETYQLVGDYK